MAEGISAGCPYDDRSALTRVLSLNRWTAELDWTAVWTAVWVLGAGEKADDGFVSHSGACEGVGGCTGWFDWPVPWVVALALDHYHY